VKTGFVGRRKPYTLIGIRRKPCSRCGRPSVAQWQACANGRRFVPLCTLCDVKLNQVILDFMRLPGRSRLMLAYKRRMGVFRPAR
jgi:hypothetical protein